MGTALQTFTISGTSIVPLDHADPLDPRGVLWTWEAPSSRATYVVGCDPTVGITGWHRDLRTADDVKTDNAAIEVIRVGDIENGGKDVQVAEYAAPIDFAQLAVALNTIGRFYSGADEDGQSLVIIEVYPGPGLMTQRDLMSHHGYLRLYTMPYLDTLVPSARRNSPFGWYATRQSVRDLWIKGLHHIHSKHIILHSPWLVEEMRDCEPDETTMSMKATFGRHDDRVRAILLALWAAHHWNSMVELVPTEIKPTNSPKWQASAMSYDEMLSQWEERFNDIVGDSP